MPDRWQCAQRHVSLPTQPIGGRNTAPDNPAPLPRKNLKKEIPLKIMTLWIRVRNQAFFERV